MRSISPDEAKTAFPRPSSRDHVTFYSVGPLPVEAVAASLEKAFGGWTSDAAGYAPEAWPAAHFNRRPKSAAGAGTWRQPVGAVRGAAGARQRRKRARRIDRAVANLLGDDFSSRLNSVIREEKGYSYGVSSYLLSPMKAGSGLVVATTVERANTGPAITEILKGFAGLTTLPVAQDEVDRTVTVYRRALAGSGRNLGRAVHFSDWRRRQRLDAGGNQHGARRGPGLRSMPCRSRRWPCRRSSLR